LILLKNIQLGPIYNKMWINYEFDYNVREIYIKVLKKGWIIESTKCHHGCVFVVTLRSQDGSCRSWKRLVPHEITPDIAWDVFHD